MADAKRWNVEVVIDEHEDRTRARARLHTTHRADLVGIGFARRNPADVDVPEIGEEVAASRALSDLAVRLLEAVASDIEALADDAANSRR